MFKNDFFQYINEEIIRDQDLICLICQQPFDDPYSTPCRHAFCHKCIQTRLNNRFSCPSCGQSLISRDLTPTPFFVIKMLDRLLVECLGCQQTNILRKDFKQHLEDVCPKQVVPCNAADIRCPWQGRKNQLQIHLEQCEYERMRPVLTKFIDENEAQKKQISTQQSTIDKLNTCLAIMQRMIAYTNERLEKLIEKEMPVSSVKLRQENLTDLDMGIIIQKCLINGSCTELDLCGNEITDQGFELLSYHLRQNKTLRKLNIGSNPITADGIRSIAEALSNNKCVLETLYMAKVNMDDQCVMYLADMLKTNTRLKSLGIFVNQISDLGVRYLSEALVQKNTTLKNLYIQANTGITDASVDDLIQILEHHTALSLMDVFDCSLTEVGQQRLQKFGGNRVCL